jgi:hypothetical protein
LEEKQKQQQLGCQGSRSSLMEVLELQEVVGWLSCLNPDAG